MATPFADKLKAMRNGYDHHNEELEGAKIEIRSLQRALDQQQIENLPTYAANVLTKFLEVYAAKKERKGGEGAGNKSSNATTRCMSTSEDIDAKQLAEVADLPSKFLKIIKGYPKLVKRRNEACHATEARFAKLLLSEVCGGVDSPLYRTWAPLFPFTYGMTCEELADTEEDEANLFFLDDE
ncbi:MAG: hypothetical protein M1825_002484 [Sarcosagium campestre]|nr:MAG: hypothetical protein M1825_002484 [Sarcosagium campestre]